MSIGDLITYVCLAIALWYVPRYLLRVYAPGLYARIKLSIENAARDLQARDYARYQAKQAARGRLYEDTEPEPLGSDAFSLLNGKEPETNGSANPAELFLNAAEVVALQRMIEHNKTAAKPSKSSTIQAGFGVSRGGSTAYQRASLIYDTLFGAPAPAVRYREQTPEQKELRKQLNLN